MRFYAKICAPNKQQWEIKIGNFHQLLGVTPKPRQLDCHFRPQIHWNAIRFYPSPSFQPSLLFTQSNMILLPYTHPQALEGSFTITLCAFQRSFSGLIEVSRKFNDLLRAVLICNGPIFKALPTVGGTISLIQ